MITPPHSPFEAALRGRYHEWRKLGYPANRFYQLFSPHCKRYIGGVAAARSVLNSETAGFAFLKKHGRLDLTVEALMLQPQWHSLFRAEELAMAARKIGQRFP